MQYRLPALVRILDAGEVVLKALPEPTRKRHLQAIACLFRNPRWCVGGNG
jgi:hypothetical protein